MDFLLTFMRVKPELPLVHQDVLVYDAFVYNAKTPKTNECIDFEGFTLELLEEGLCFKE